MIIAGLSDDAGTRRFLFALTECGFTRGPVLDGQAVIHVGDRRMRVVVDFDDPSRIATVIHEGHRYTPDEAAELLVS